MNLRGRVSRSQIASWIMGALLAYAPLNQAAAYSERFFNLEAELPPAWNCNREGNDFVCLNNSQETEKSAAIVITVREKGPDDSLSFFKEQLSRPRSLEFQGLPLTSQVKEIREREINGQVWIEGIHVGSEIQGYVTHYIVTTDDSTSALISISIHQDDHDLAFPALAKFIGSLRLLPADGSQGGGVPTSVAKEFGDIKRGASQGLIKIGGINFKKMHLIAAAAALFAIMLMAYAVFTD